MTEARKDPLPCEKCGSKHVLACWTKDAKKDRMVLTHWYCPDCKHDFKAIGRERQIEF